MSQQTRIVQLSAASLALVLSRSSESCRIGDEKHHSSSSTGQDIFEDFKSQNLRSLWNKRLVKAMTAIYFQGWLENLVLLVQGTAGHLEVLREAWMRRALKSPKGFLIRAVGDLNPMQMSPIPQSQFIPLSEVLCSVISDMNAAHVTVNQEALINHMAKAYPGMTIPTQDILYNTLGSLIKERKIYHTGDGYFIVTAQTYFITNSLVKDKNRWPSCEDDPPPPPPITYLVSNESCMEASEIEFVAHCKSCSCYTPHLPAPVQEHQCISECAGRSMRSPHNSKHSIQHQSTSTALDCHTSEMSKSTTSRREKEKPTRRFGLSLFRRNVGKKDRAKKEYATFSGQFPPEEWPVRDEENLDNLPRDLEHAIIRRINPTLTVDNLVRHTVLMKKLEERGNDKAVDKGISTEVLGSRQGPRVSKKSNSKPSHSKKRVQSSREKQREAKDHTPLEATDHGHRDEADQDVHHQPYGDYTVADAKDLYKRRIENPFQGRMARDMQKSSHKAQKKRDGKAQTVDKLERMGHRSKSWDPCRIKAGVSEPGRSLTVGQGSCERLSQRTVIHHSNGKNKKDFSGEYGASYPDTSTLRIDDKVKHGKEGKARSRLTQETTAEDTKPKTLQGRALADDSRNVLGQIADMEFSAHQDAVSYDATVNPPLPGVTLCSTSSLPKPLCAREQNQGLGCGTNHLQRLGSTLWDHSRFPNDDGALYHQVAEDDACSSLCLNEDSISTCSEVSQTDMAQSQKFPGALVDWNTAVVDRGLPSGHQDPTAVALTQEGPTWCHSNAPQVGLLPEALGAGTARWGLHVWNSGSEAPGTGDSTSEKRPSAAGPGACNPHGDTGLQEPAEQLGAFDSLHASKSHVERPGITMSGEAVENQSSTGDSGVDSPRTQLSMTSASSDALMALRQRTFLQSVEPLCAHGNVPHIQDTVMHSQGEMSHLQGSMRGAPNSLLQLTPVMNV